MRAHNVSELARSWGYAFVRRFIMCMNLGAPPPQRSDFDVFRCRNVGCIVCSSPMLQGHLRVAEARADGRGRKTRATFRVLVAVHLAQVP